MEETDPEMKELEEKQRSLGRVFDSLNVQASSVLLFTAQWKDLEDHFESTRSELRTRLEDLEERVKLVAEVEARAVRVKAETAARVKELGEMEAVIEKKRRGVEEGERLLSCTNLLIEEKREEVRKCESEYLRVDRLVRDRYRQLDLVEERVRETMREVEIEERRLEEIREECESELEEKEERVKLVEKSIANCDRILELKERLISVVDMKLEKSMEKVDRKVEELNLVHDKLMNEVEVKEKCLDSLEESLVEREKDLVSLQKLVEECFKGGELARDGRGLEQFMDENLKDIDSFGTELSVILKESSDAAKLVLDAMQGFYPDNRELDYDLRVRRRGCCLLLKELRKISPRISSEVREEAIKIAANWKAKMTVVSDTDLEVVGFLRLVAAYDLVSLYDANELKRLESRVSLGQQAAHIGQALGITAPASLQSSLDPAKLVLDWMQTDFSQHWTKVDVCLEASSIKTCIFILQQLMRVVPHVGPHVKQDAMKLELQWQVKMRADAENAWEILAFLHFIAAYGLTSTLNVDEIVKLLGMIAQHKQALEFCQTLPSEDKIPGEFIHCLVERKQLMEAIGLICTFKLTTKFPPVPLLKEYMEKQRKCCRDRYMKEKLREEKIKVVDQNISDLRAVITLIKDYNLEAEYPSSKVENEITQLEQVMEKWKTVQLQNVNKEQKRGTKRSSSSPPSKLEPQQQTYKSHRTSVIPPRPHLLQTSMAPPSPVPLQLYTPLYLQHNFSPQLLHSRQFGAIQNAGIHQFGPNYHPNLPSWNHLSNFGNPYYRF